jgi:hypothetical protein
MTYAPLRVWWDGAAAVSFFFVLSGLVLSLRHFRTQEWTAAGVFVTLWARGLEEYDALRGLDWRWLAMDGATIKAPLGGIRIFDENEGNSKLLKDNAPPSSPDGSQGGAERQPALRAS